MLMWYGSPSWQGVWVLTARAEEEKRVLVDCVYANRPSAACELGLAASIW
jgi:hypothetical protein